MTSVAKAISQTSSSGDFQAMQVTVSIRQLWQGRCRKGIWEIPKSEFPEHTQVIKKNSALSPNANLFHVTASRNAVLSPCTVRDEQSSSPEFGFNTIDLILGEARISVSRRNHKAVQIVSTCQHICPTGIICGCDVYDAKTKNPILKPYEAEFWNKDALIIMHFRHL